MTSIEQLVDACRREGQGEIILVGVSAEMDSLLSAVACAVTEDDDAALWTQWHAGPAPAPEILDDALVIGALIGRADAQLDGPVEEFDGSCLNICLFADREGEHLRALSAIFAALAKTHITAAFDVA